MRGLSAAAAVHQRRRRPVNEHPPARAAAARRPRPGPHPGIQAGLPDPIERGTDHRLVATQRGRRVRLRYLGVVKNHAWLRNRAAAINLRTLLNAGLTRHDGAWALA